METLRVLFQIQTRVLSKLVLSKQVLSKPVLSKQVLSKSVLSKPVLSKLGERSLFLGAQLKAFQCFTFL